jgi:hypothetical protein
MGGGGDGTTSGSWRGYEYRVGLEHKSELGVDEMMGVSVMTWVAQDVATFSERI